MHIPDGFVDVKTAVAASVLSVAGLGYALYQVRRELPSRRVPLLGLGAAFVFAAQMVNFPVIGGTSGHLVGGALIAALLGAPAAVVVISTVLIAQCFLFADGGVTALGANIFNMAVVAPVVGAGVHKSVCRLLSGRRGQVAAVAFAGWCSTVAASLACAGQLAWSGTVGWAVAFPAMTGVHMLIGIGEGAVSALVFYAVAKARPELLKRDEEVRVENFVGYGLLVAIGIALFVAPFACRWPDGLEAVAAKLGFEHEAKESMISPMQGFGVPMALAGVVGALVAFALAVFLSRLLVKNQSEHDKPNVNI